MIPKHDEDFYGWSMANVTLLKQGKYREADMDNIIEEMESMGASERRELVSRMAQLIFHLLKWKYQPELRCRSWEGTIEEQRIRVKDILEYNPSLKSMIEEASIKAYRLSLSLVRKETPLDLKLLPAECPYTFEQIINEEFYPE